MTAFVCFVVLIRIPVAALLSPKIWTGSIFALLLAFGSPAVPQETAAPVASARNAGIVLEIDANTRTRVIATLGGKSTSLGPFSASETLIQNGRTIDAFRVTSHELRPLSDARGVGQRLTVSASAGDIEKRETIDSFSEFPTMLFVRVQYTNRGSKSLLVDGWRGQAHSIDAGAIKNGSAFWSSRAGPTNGGLTGRFR